MCQPQATSDQHGGALTERARWRRARCPKPKRNASAPVALGPSRPQPRIWPTCGSQQSIHSRAQAGDSDLLTGTTDSDDRLAQANHWLGRVDRVPNTPGPSDARFKPTMRAPKTVSEQKADRGLPPAPTPPRGSGRLYTATWTMLGMLSLGYIGVLLLQPDWAAPITTQSLRTEERPDPTQVIARLTGEVHSLRETIADLRQELTEVKSKAAAREVEVINQQARAAIDPPSPALPQPDEPGTESAERAPEPAKVEIAPHDSADVLELRTTRTESPPEPAAEPEPPPLVRQATAIHALEVEDEHEDEHGAEAKATEAEAEAAGPEGDAATQAEPIAADREAAREEPNQPRTALAPPPPAPVRKVVVLDVRPVTRPVSAPSVASAPASERHALRMATGSVRSAEPAAITFGPPTVTPASEAFAIQLDAGPSLDALRLRWSVLNERYRGTLGALEPRYLESGSAAAPSYELLAGPIASLEEASRICAELQDRSVPCSVGGQFAGEAL